MAEEEDNRRKEREQRRKLFSTTPLDPYEEGRPPLRPGTPCEDTEEEIQQEFMDPEGCPPPPPIPDAVPNPLVFRNSEITVTCADVVGGPPSGNPVTIPEGEVEDRVYFQNIPRISVSQMTYIAGVPDGVISVVSDISTSITDVGQMLSLDYEQANWLVSRRNSAAASVTSKAHTLALNSLRCVWWNEEQTAQCGEGALTTPGAGQEGQVHNPSVVLAEKVSSTVSQDTANQQALNQAVSALRCLWGNTEQVADCVTDLEKTEAVPNDAEPVGLATRRRVGSVVVAENTYYSDVSQDDADQLAKVAAVGALECFYINPTKSVACDPDEDGVPASNTPTNTGVSADEGISGNPVTIPEGFIESELSTADATGQAVALAESLRECFWLNDPVEIYCPSVMRGEVEYEPSSTSPIPYASVSPGEVVSLVSKAEANAEALVRAQLSLDCLYCNKEVTPKCIPGDYTVTDLPIPLSDVSDAWSTSATLGAPAGMFCTEDPLEAQGIADSLGNIPIPTSSTPFNCSYGNDSISASCVGDPEEGAIVVRPPSNLINRGGPCRGGAPGHPVDPENPYQPLLPITGPVGVPMQVSLFEPDVGADLSSLSYPNPFDADPNKRSLTIAQNTITIQEDKVPSGYAVGDPNRAKRYANELATMVAIASLDCFFANCPGEYRCHGDMSNNEYDPPLVGSSVSSGLPLYGLGEMVSPLDSVSYPVSDESTGSPTNPVSVAEAQFTSRVSKLEVDAAMRTYLLTALNCFWTHGEVTALCGSILTTSDNGYDYTYVEGTGVMGYAPGKPLQLIYWRSNVDGFVTLSVPQGKYAVWGGGASWYVSDTKPIAGVYRYSRFNGDEGAMVHEGSKGHPSDPVKVGANLFPSDIHPNLPWIQAYQLAVSQLNCYFLSKARSAGCANLTPKPPEDWPPEVPYPVYQNIPTAGSKPRFSIPAGAYQSMFSQAHADAQASTAASASLYCLWDSYEVISYGDCAVGTVPAGPVRLEEGAVSSPESSHKATEIAKKMADSMVTCITPPEAGPAGNDGAQTSCDGQCYGYYS